MPVQKLSYEDIDTVWNMLEEVRDDRVDIEDTIDYLNHFFADVYGYRSRSNPTKRKFRSTKARTRTKQKKRRVLNSWQKFVKANSKKPRFKSMNNTARLKKLGIAYRKTAAYKRNKKK